MAEHAKEQRQEFPTTWWSLIGQALADETIVRAVALQRLVLRYRPPLRAHLVLHKRLDDDLADDLLQGFITDKILEQYLLRHADADKGKFRALLVRALENYCIDWMRARRVEPLSGLSAVLDEAPADSSGGADMFDIAWAQQLLEEVLAAMKADCDANGQADIWGVFEHRLLVPLFEGVEPLGYDEVCARFGFGSPERASNALITAKRKFQRAFDRVAAWYRHDGEQAEDVLRELIDTLSRVGPLEWRRVPAARAGDHPSEPEFSEHLDDSHPARIARLLELPPEANSLWLHTDLGGLMRHLLGQRLSDLELDIAGAPTDSAGAVHATIVTLADLCRHSQPPIEMLEAVKRYGRSRVRRSAALPDEIASALYFASIAAALVRHGKRISTSSDELLRYGFQRLLDRPWIETPLRELLEDAISRLDPEREDSA
jgi:DNA-directed RNA polymerase specialized sigma24 family protein